MRRALAWFAVSAIWLASFGSARAQDDPKRAPPSPQEPSAPTPAEPTLLDPQECLARMTLLYPQAATRPSAAGPGATVEERAARAKAESAWKTAVRDLAKAGDDYARAIGDGAPDATGLYYRGVGKAIAKDILPAHEVPAACEVAVDALAKFLAAADPNSALRSDAERHLGTCLLRLNRLDEAVPHLRTAVLAYQKEGRRDDAGVAAYDAMAALNGAKRTAELAAFADAIDAGKADFGGSTTTIRKLLAASRLAVGRPLPDLPPVKDVDGKTVAWKPGKPLLVHFFVTGRPDGRATAFREIETEIRPLAQRWREKGLAIVGVSMDLEMSREKLEKMKKDWDEWGLKGEPCDGSLASVRAWTAKQGIDWPWTWDGLWLKNPVSLALGGVGVTAPYAILVDKDGVVRWHGEAPFGGLADAVAALF